jgi:transposase
MNFYCGIDLGARESQICVIDKRVKKVLEVKTRNNLEHIKQLLEPYKKNLEIVVESTFNWYWLVDGLQAAGFKVVLAHTLGLHLITAAKVKTDRRDAFALAKLLLAGMIPTAYIYPAQTRPVRDLLRRRGRLVQVRAGEYGSLRRLLLREGILSRQQQEIKMAEDSDLERWFADPRVRLPARQELSRIQLYSQQIAELEAASLAEAKTDRGFEVLQQLPGIGPILALTILYETGELWRFGSEKEFSSYCRVVPGVAQSGSVTRRGRGSKQGNHYLKWAFSQAAVHAVRCYPNIRRYYERQLRRRRGRARQMVVYNMIAHKLAQGAYHVLKEHTAYREELLFGR